MSTAMLVEDALRFRADPDGDELSAAILVNRALNENLNLPELNDRLRELVDACSQREQPWLYLAELGFAGDRENYDLIDNSRLDWLLEQRRGIPISLGVLLIHLARTQGLAAVGINFPGHFLVRVGDQLVDPFRMQSTSELECLAGLGNVPAPQDAFQEASPTAVLLRMLNNVKYQFARRAEWHRSLDMLDLQMAVDPDNPQLVVERGEMWWRLGSAATAREAWERALSMAEGRDAEVVKLVRRRLREIGPDEGLLH